MENDPFIDGVPIKMVIFHGYVKQPKGIIFQKTGVFPKVDDLSKILMRFPRFSSRTCGVSWRAAGRIEKRAWSLPRTGEHRSASVFIGWNDSVKGDENWYIIYTYIYIYLYSTIYIYIYIYTTWRVIQGEQLMFFLFFCLLSSFMMFRYVFC